MKLEVVVIPVSDVDRAKRFYGGLGWRLDADFVIGDESRGPVHASRLAVLDPLRHRAHVGRAGLGTDFTSSYPTSRLRAPSWSARGVDVSDVFHRCWSGPVGAGSTVRIRRGAATSLRHVQRSGRQRVAVAGGHHPVPGPDRLERDELRLRIGSGERDAARVGRPRRARDAHGRPAGRELAGLVRRVHGGGAGRQAAAVMSGGPRFECPRLAAQQMPLRGWQRAAPLQAVLVPREPRRLGAHWSAAA